MRLIRSHPIFLVFLAVLLGAEVLWQESTKKTVLVPAASVETTSQTNRVKAQILISHARADMENGRVEDAEKKFRAAIVLDPDNRAIEYYLTLLRERGARRQNDSVKPVYPVIKNYDGTLQYGVPTRQRYLREVADDLKGR